MRIQAVDLPQRFISLNGASNPDRGYSSPRSQIEQKNNTGDFKFLSSILSPQLLASAKLGSSVSDEAAESALPYFVLLDNTSSQSSGKATAVNESRRIPSASLVGLFLDIGNT
jgi:hypothetical protein